MREASDIRDDIQAKLDDGGPIDSRAILVYLGDLAGSVAAIAAGEDPADYADAEAKARNAQARDAAAYRDAHPELAVAGVQLTDAQAAELYDGGQVADAPADGVGFPAQEEGDGTPVVSAQDAARPVPSTTEAGAASAGESSGPMTGDQGAAPTSS